MAPHLGLDPPKNKKSKTIYEWCGYTRNPATYKHKGLPCGWDLSYVQTREQQMKLFNVYAENTSKL